MSWTRNGRRTSKRLSERHERERGEAQIGDCVGVETQRDDPNASVQHTDTDAVVDDCVINSKREEDYIDECSDFSLDVPSRSNHRRKRRSSISEVFETEQFEEMVENLILSYQQDMKTLSDGGDSMPSCGLFPSETYDAILCDAIMYRDGDANSQSSQQQHSYGNNDVLCERKTRYGRGGFGTQENVRPNAPGSDLWWQRPQERKPPHKDVGTQTVSPMTIERQVNHVMESASPFRVVGPEDATYLRGQGTHVPFGHASSTPGTPKDCDAQEKISLLRVLFETIWEEDMPTLKDLRSNGFDRRLVNKLVQQHILQRHREYRQPQRFSWTGKDE